jgi:predicted ATPase/DNA-binding CsgD family transcriptional regulator
MTEPLSHARAGPATGLPLVLTSLLGREQDIAGLRTRLLDDDARLVTLTGPGGSGKTRLAVAVAEAVAVEDGSAVAFVDLSAVRDAAGLWTAVARAFDLPDEGGGPDAAVSAFLRDRTMLLVLDNLEQIAGAARPIRALLAASPGLTVLATSRTPLRLAGEQRWPVEPLPLPLTAAVQSVRANPAVCLFVARARLIKPDFALTDANAATIADICRRLDGLPLAIELAAVRARLLSPEALLARLSGRLSLLAGGAEDLPDRQRTMRDAIAWSYDLLTEPEQRLFRRLSVFVGGFTLEAAESVGGEEALDVLARLVDHSLVSPTGDAGDATRFRMLETVREYGIDQLAVRQEGDVAIDGLVAWVSHLAAKAPRRTRTGADVLPNEILRREQPNIAEALGQLEARGDRRRTLDVVTGFGPWWLEHGYYATAADWTARALGAPETGHPRERAQALVSLGTALHLLGRHDEETAALRRAEDLFRRIDDEPGEAFARYRVGLLHYSQGRHAEARSSFEASMATYRRLADAAGQLMAENCLALVLLDLGEYETAADIYERHLADARRSNDRDALAITLHNLGCIASELDDDARAVRYFAEAQPLSENGQRDGLSQNLSMLGWHTVRLGDDIQQGLAHCERGIAIATEDRNRWALSVGLYSRGRARLHLGHPHQTETDLKEALSLRRDLGVRWGMAQTLHALAILAHHTGQPESAARLLGAGDGVRRRMGLPVTTRNPELDRLRDESTTRRYLAAYRDGVHLDDDRAVALGLQTEFAPSDAPAARRVDPSISLNAPSSLGDPDLTPREVEVLKLVAAGKTNAEIGDALFISPLTAKTHVANLLGKLGVDNRAAAATWATHRGLA